MNQNPFVSVIVTTYNRKELLKQTIESVLSQTYQNYELIVVDNYSNYDFNEFVKSFHSNKIRAFQNQNNGIIAVNRNYAVKQAIGDFLAFCDDDDYWMPNKLEKCVAYSENADFICHDCRMTNGKYMKAGAFIRDDKRISMLLTGNTIPFSTVVVRKDVIDKVGLFDVDPLYVTVEDWDLWMRCFAITTRLFVVHEELGVYTVSSSNTSASLVVIQKQRDFYKKYSFLLHGIDKWRGYSALCYRLARRYHSLGCCCQALKYYLVSALNFYSITMSYKSLCGIVLSLLKIKK